MSLDLLKVLPKSITLSIIRGLKILPLDLSKYDEKDTSYNNLTNLYNLNLETRFLMLREISLKPMYTEVTNDYVISLFETKFFGYRYIKFRRWNDKLLTFIMDNDFGPLNPTDPSSQPLTSYLCLIGGSNSLCRNQPTGIASYIAIYRLFNNYIDINDLGTGNLLTLNEPLKKLLNPIAIIYNKHTSNPIDLPLNTIDYKTFYRLIHMHELPTFKSPEDIRTFKSYLLDSAPDDQANLFQRIISEETSAIERSYKAAKDAYQKKIKMLSILNISDRPPKPVKPVKGDIDYTKLILIMEELVENVSSSIYRYTAVKQDEYVAHYPRLPR